MPHVSFSSSSLTHFSTRALLLHLRHFPSSSPRHDSNINTAYFGQSRSLGRSLQSHPHGSTDSNSDLRFRVHMRFALLTCSLILSSPH
ncbi:hypothetical protein RIF29_21696 [Crotalaria pallida]|uniref:Uncharacterized protein n=1 Tax=Crotalaria pallida TaxID=3830 RepID=A0AAN9FBY7_CROPI